MHPQKETTFQELRETALFTALWMHFQGFWMANLAKEVKEPIKEHLFIHTEKT